MNNNELEITERVELAQIARETAARLKRLEEAAIQINHATEDFAEWKGEVSADLKWLKYLVGAGAASGLFTAAVKVMELLK